MLGKTKKIICYIGIPLIFMAGAYALHRWMVWHEVRSVTTFEGLLATADALAVYASRHEGRFPTTWNDMAADDIIAVQSDSPLVYQYSSPNLHRGITVIYPDRYDIAWGIDINEIDEEGQITLDNGEQRYAVDLTSSYKGVVGPNVISGLNKDLVSW